LRIGVADFVGGAAGLTGAEALAAETAEDGAAEDAAAEDDALAEGVAEALVVADPEALGAVAVTG
jgi:hypothetical protein